MKRTKKQKLPAGWTEDRIRKLAEYYDNQTEDEQVAEQETAYPSRGPNGHGCSHRIGSQRS